MTGIIYKAENKVNGMIYIGKTIQPLEQRIARHINGRPTYFHATIMKYGIEVFMFTSIDLAETDAELSEKEKYWIKYFGSRRPYGYNLTDGGEGTTGAILSEETKDKISAAHMGMAKPWIAEINKRRTGEKRSEETKQKLRESSTGKKHSIETKQKLSEFAKRRTGQHHSEQTKEKMRLSQSGDKSNNAKLTWDQVISIREMHRDKKYTSQELARQFGVTGGTINHILRHASWIGRKDMARGAG